MSKYAKKILLATKPAPVLESLYKGRGQWQLGSLTHAINSEAVGYLPLPEFPRTAPDPSVRDVEDNSWGKPSPKKKDKGFYGDSEEEEESSGSGSDFYSSISGSDESGSEDSESDSEGEGLVGVA